ncbi:MAG: TIR domain-containing protein [Xanthomonadaceae bacterium]|nr:TIR domain-containing protein [Xanthomonadaceae bacterium]
MTGKITDPRVFISYSWTNPVHEQWVVGLAERLRSDGVDTVFDKWDLKEGQDKFHFMEKMVKDPGIHRVLMVCDRVYSEKADGRLGGVGTESQIISKEIYENVTQEKFVPIALEKNEEGKICLPAFASSRIYIDLGDKDRFEENYEKLLRNIYDRPFYKKPPKGVMPDFLKEESQDVSYRCVSIQKQIRSALMNDRVSAVGLVDDFFESVLVQLEEERTKGVEAEVDLRVLGNMSRLQPIRDSIIDVVMDLIKYKPDFSIESIKEFLEKTLQFNFRPKHITAWKESDFDAYKFFNYELLLYVFAALIKKQKYVDAAILLNGNYFFYDGNNHRDDDVTVFDGYIASLEEFYKRRVNSNLITIVGEKLKERSVHSQIKFTDLMLADSLIYFVKSIKGSLFAWYPRTLFYREHSQVFEFYVRLKSRAHFEKVKSLFEASSAAEFKDLVQAALDRHVAEGRTGGWNERSIPSIQKLAHLDVLCTVP